MFNLDSEEIILILLNEGEAIFEVEADTTVPVASLTKIMTAILTLEEKNITGVNSIGLQEMVTITPEMIAGLNEFAVAGLQVGQVVSVEDLLYLAMLPSDGDAAQALAISTAGSLTAFADMMNKKAVELGMKQTYFSNPVGLDTNNYSTARDMATLLEYALKNPEFQTIFESFSYYSTALSRTIYKTAAAGNYFRGLKTGYTNAAGRCLASTASKNGVNYLLVNLGAGANSTNHITDAETIYDYYMTNYSYREILGVGETLTTLEVKDSETTELAVYSEEAVTRYLANEKDLKELTRIYTGSETITNKNQQGDYLGEYKILDGEKILYTKAIYLETEIEFYPYWLWNTGVVVGIGIIILIILLAVKRRRK